MTVIYQTTITRIKAGEAQDNARAALRMLTENGHQPLLQEIRTGLQANRSLSAQAFHFQLHMRCRTSDQPQFSAIQIDVTNNKSDTDPLPGKIECSSALFSIQCIHYRHQLLTPGARCVVIE